MRVSGHDFLDCVQREPVAEFYLRERWMPDIEDREACRCFHEFLLRDLAFGIFGADEVAYVVGVCSCGPAEACEGLFFPRGSGDALADLMRALAP